MSTPNDELAALLGEAAEVTRPSVEGLGQLSELAGKMLDIEEQMEELAARAAALNEVHKQLAERDIPALFDELKIKSFTLQNGAKLEIGKKYFGKIPDERKGEAVLWLEEHQYGDLVKTALEAKFGMGEFEKALELQARLQKEGYQVTADQSVHSSTLGKFVKDRMEAQQEIPQMLFNPVCLRAAKIKVPKPKAPKKLKI